MKSLDMTSSLLRRATVQGGWGTGSLLKPIQCIHLNPPSLFLATFKQKIFTCRHSAAT